jgi:hypothetical protein
LNDVAVTGLAVLSFLGAGNTMITGRHKKVVATGLKYLQSVQDADSGLFGQNCGGDFLYGHAVASFAIVEGYYLSRLPVLKAPAQKALEFIARTRTPGRGWGRRSPSIDQDDVRTTGWMLLALFAGRDAGLKVDRSAIQEGMNWIEGMTDPSSFRTRYQEDGSLAMREPDEVDRWPAERTECMTAVACLLRIFNGDDPGSVSALKRATHLILAKLPAWDESTGSIDFAYWLFGSCATSQIGGQPWNEWSRAMEPTVVGHQRTSGDETGSWDPQVDPWGDDGGRVYATAINVFCLEVLGRYHTILLSR